MHSQHFVLFHKHFAATSVTAAEPYRPAFAKPQPADEYRGRAPAAADTYHQRAPAESSDWRRQVDTPGI